MKGRASEHLIADLARDLRPVRRVPKLAWITAAVALLWALVATAVLVAYGARSDLVSVVTESPGYAAVGVGLALGGAGGVLAALGSAVPDRPRMLRWGVVLAALGGFVGLVVAPTLFLERGGPLATASSSWSAAAVCEARSIALALPPGIVLAWFLARALPWRPLVSAASALAGCIALGAFVVHVSCPLSGARHWIFGHALAPVIGVLLFAGPLSRVLARQHESA